tara:strand:- start:244 stop:630 length:387 start_codon:yes stop_codon:yes gene_type:complete
MAINEEILQLTNIQTDNDFQKITNAIDAMYAKQNQFRMLIETQKVRQVDFKYLYKIGKYLNNVRNTYTRLLTQTQIRVYDDFIFNLLYTLFTWVASPVAKVVVIYYEGGYTDDPSDRPIKKIKEYYPH